MNITEIATAILPNVMEIIGTIAMFMAAKIGIPWLREQRIFSLVRKLVKGAEKAAEAGKIVHASQISGSLIHSSNIWHSL